MWSRSGTYPRRRWLLCRAGSSEGLWKRKACRPEITKTALGAGASYSGRHFGAPGREKSRSAPSARFASEREEETFPRIGETHSADRDDRRTRSRQKGQGKGIRFLPTVMIGDEKCVAERERQKLDATVTVGGQRIGKKGMGKGIRFLPTVTIGDEKCVTERERRKLDATVTVGGQRIGKKGMGKA